MPQPTITVDPRIYGGEAPSSTDVPVIDPNSIGGAGRQPYVAPAPVPQSGIGAGTSAVAEGEAAIARANVPVADIADSALAAAKNWTTTRFVKALMAPSFAHDDTFNPKELINHAPMQLSDEEQKFLAESHSGDEYQFKLQQLTDQRSLYSQMGDHPWLSTAIGFADPIYLAIDLASAGTAAPLTSALGLGVGAGRALSAAGSFAANTAVGYEASKVAPMSDTEILSTALLNSAGAAMAYKPGTGWSRIDPEYPSDAMVQSAAKMAENGSGIEQRIVGESAQTKGARPADAPATAPAAAGDVPQASRVNYNPQLITQEQLANWGIRRAQPRDSDAYTELAKHEADPTYGPMITALRAEQGEALADVGIRRAEFKGGAGVAAYVRQDHTIYLPEDYGKQNPAFVALHEAVHGLTVQKLAYGLENPGTAHGTITAQLEGLRQQAAKLLPDEYLNKNVYEFTAGLYSGDTAFTRALASIPAQGAPNMLSRAADTVRKLLGIAPANKDALTKALGLTDELMNQKIKLDVPGQATIHFAPNMSGTPSQVRQKVASWWSKQDASTAAGKLGRAGEWSLSKQVRNTGTEGKRVSNLLLDDPIDMTHDSAASQRQAIRSDLTRTQVPFEQALRDAMAKQGIGVRQTIQKTQEALQVQRKIERAVHEELERRMNAVRTGSPLKDPNVDPDIAHLADLHDTATAAGLQERKNAKVHGADEVKAGPGYATRKWNNSSIEAIEKAFMSDGSSIGQARRAIRNEIASAIQKAQPTIERGMAEDLATAIQTRARNKGYMEDTGGGKPTLGDDGAQALRKILDGSGIDRARMQQIEEFLTGAKDDAARDSTLKHRIELDALHQFQTPDGKTRSLMDMMDSTIHKNLDAYLDDAAGDSALARKGLVSSSDITKLRSEFLHGIEKESERRTAANTFDQIIASLKGEPVGEEMNAGMRRLQAITTSVGLAGSGLWQVMDTANLAAKYGLVRTFKETMASMPLFRSMMASRDVHEAGSLANVLAHNSYQDMRIRPFLQKLEDNFSIPLDDRATLALQQVKQLVPYVNGMRYVHHFQANMASNLIVDTIRRAAAGDAKAASMLELYGLEGHQLGALKADIGQHGMRVDNWSNGTWEQVRGPLNKMMDDAVMRNRTGEIPAFAQFSTLGKFIFTYRSFVLGAQNKLLGGTLGRHGFAGLGLLFAYQFPLSMASTYANSVLHGKPIDDPAKLASQAMQQMSAMGMLGELWGIMSGDKQQFGAPGLLALDKLYKTGSQIGTGHFAQAGAGLAQAVPLLGILPGIKALASQVPSGHEKKE